METECDKAPLVVSRTIVGIRLEIITANSNNQKPYNSFVVYYKAFSLVISVFGRCLSDHQ